MATHDNIHIPGESFPHWIWFVIEFAIVFAVSALISRAIVGNFADFEEGMRNWMFWGIVAAIFLSWYVGIRGLIIKKPVFEGHN